MIFNRLIVKARPFLWHFFPVPVFLLPDDDHYSSKKRTYRMYVLCLCGQYY